MLGVHQRKRQPFDYAYDLFAAFVWGLQSVEARTVLDLPSLVPFLNGGAPPVDVRVVFIFSKGHHDLLRLGAECGDFRGAVGVLDALGLVIPSRGCLTAYSSGILIGSYGIGYEWVLDGHGGEQFRRGPVSTVHSSDRWRSDMTG